MLYNEAVMVGGFIVHSLQSFVPSSGEVNLAHMWDDQQTSWKKSWKSWKESRKAATVT